MIGQIIQKFFGSRNERELKRLGALVTRINELENGKKYLFDEDLKKKTPEFKTRLDRGEPLDDLLPEAFAVVREAGKRVLNMRHFDVQLIGGIALHEGKIAEMKTGEGKTLAATLPIYLNALTGRGTHLVTVNDYLARRDAEWMGKIYNFLGLSVGIVVHGLTDRERQQAYNSDVTYGTNNEFGFDYLRDNMKFSKEECVQRELNFAIVDEVDSILIDEARTPLIISGPAEESTDKYYKINQIMPRLKDPNFYTIDEKARTVALTEEGITQAESLLGLENLYDPKNTEQLHHIHQAMKAYRLFKRDVDYVVKESEVVIVDEFTGRLMPGRRYSDGLHQALEAKESVRIENENQTLASITFQNYFRLYNKLAGMTGTADTEASEFNEIYKLEVLQIPTNMDMIRLDYPDVIYRTEKEKYQAVIEEIKELYQKGQPVLVGTISIEKSERLSGMLKRQGTPHNVLNAKNHEKEAEIIAQAGRKNTVTLSTNMAGRGTDIVLGGNPDMLVRAKGIRPTDERYESMMSEFNKICSQEKEEVKSLGGLHILGTERHESRRIDNQLRGRSGRQGDEGSSRFFLSLEDDLLRIFGSEKISGFMQRVGMEEGEPIEHKLVTRAIENAQRKVEAHNFDIRKHLLEYDDVMNKQREVVYGQRHIILKETSLKENVLDMAQEVLEETVERYCDEKLHPDEWDLEELKEALLRQFDVTLDLDEERNMKVGATTIAYEEVTPGLVYGALEKRIVEIYEEKEKTVGEDLIRQLEKYFMLQVLDAQWKDHLLAMDHLKEGIGFRGYAQKNPLNEYKKEGFDLFVGMVGRMKEEIVTLLFKFKVNTSEEVLLEHQPRRQRMVEHRGQDNGGQKPKTVRRNVKKVGRNEPCPCGSGKKYKKCCGVGS